MIQVLFILIMLAMLLCILIALFGKENKQGFIIFLIPLSIAESLLFYCSDNKEESQTVSTFMGSSSDSDDNVYICTGGSAKKYHKFKDCRWLDNCSGDVESISLDEAEELGRTPCKSCFK